MSVSCAKKVISWCLYVDPQNLDRLSEYANEVLREPLLISSRYLVGLKCNVQAAALWFPDWKLRLYIAPSLRNEPLLWKFVSDVCEDKVEIIDCRPMMHPMVERYHVFFDSNVDVSVVRDVDSILTKLDADVVNNWINDERYDVLEYIEHQMNGNCMGGGVAFKAIALKDELPISKGLTGRGHDEHVLWHLIESNVPTNRRLSYLTRMTGNGVYANEKYHFYRTLDTDPVDSLLLWPVPFFYTETGYAKDVDNKKLSSVEDHVKFATDYQVRDDHLHPTSQVSAKQKWVR